MIAARNGHGRAELPPGVGIPRVEDLHRTAIDVVNPARQEDASVREQHGIDLLRASTVQIREIGPRRRGHGKIDQLRSLLRAIRTRAS